jgi:signal transduction histidine kinase
VVGTPDGELHVVARDETEWRRQVRLLQHTDRAAKIGGWELDVGNAVMHWSDETYRLFGVTPETFTPSLDAMIDCFASGSREALRSVLLRAVQRQEPYDVELALEARTGRRLWVHATGTAEREGLNLVRLHGTFQDVDARHIMEDALWRALAQSRAAQDALRASQDRVTRLWDRVVSAQDDERRRIARELHDHAGSALTSLLVSCRVLEGAGTPGEARRQAGRLAEQLEMVIDDLARLARGLHPVALDELGLGAALERLASLTATVDGPQVLVDVALEEERLPPEVELTLYRIAQEALTNVVKHAGAANVWLRCHRDGDSVCLGVRDDGRGYDPGLERDFVRSSRLGLAGIRDRVALLGGTTTVHSGPGQGTTLEVRVPRRPVRGAALAAAATAGGPSA